MKNSFNDSKINIGVLNESVQQNPKLIVDYAERNYDKQLQLVADKIIENEKVSILLLAGPSASSKTTTAYKLKDTLQNKGLNAVVISLDDFYIDRDCLPILEDGSIDYETIDTLDLNKLSQCFGELFEKNVSEFPLFEFSTGRRALETRTVSIDDHSLIIIEGLHALNPRIINGYDKANFMKLYISPNSDYVMNDELVLSARDVRLVRRMIRDHFHRASSLPKTLEMWEKVIEAEVECIFPFKNEADYMIDSTIIYEPNIYVNYLIKLIEETEIPSTYQTEISRVKRAIMPFYSLNMDYVPSNTVLREFLD
ncbi:hypothetical protein RBG61_10380 [Paludicola sp. MB14-C6]|uniref:uridine kinase family protein n=1 Tax=Paludihabitans sp. MB14-C6 TaxID=3070656 RepID=UPI0027DCFDDC|nr:hypothetical protein [Paludicola sp. MB14-C6]WMJ22392.1 hypothetical protein RBG61_10380 [Paludicola sp. MB14-C6]